MSSGFNPVAIAFVCVLAFAFLIGLSAAVYWAWIHPLLARQRQRAEVRRRARAAAAVAFPSPQSPRDGALHTPMPGSPEKDLEKGDASIFVKEAETSADSIDDVLPLPKPTFACAKQEGRFSTSSKDGMWWFV
ncbi:hypothetical protein PsYK624_126580 [Phanerochaete sordida]|uniref:Uncharacterized protein n=1 Tax=Phanerochaete sordida TaxID=48140 RepID=A0A9P3LIE5_9APHY|nr:hypothetical protein PsYK624_126580 [Phanerochaete sordida]